MGRELRLYEGSGGCVPAWVAVGGPLYDRWAHHSSVLAKAFAPASNLESARCRYGDGPARLLGFFTQTVGLQTVSPGVNAFLTAVYVVLVPFMWWVVAKRKPAKTNIVAALVAIVGIWLVSVTSASGSLSIGFGEVMTLLCAFFFAAHIVSVSIFSAFYDVLMLTVIQFITEGLLGLVTGAVFETLPTFSQITPVIVSELAFVVLFATIFAFGVQNIALARIEPTQASLILSLESVFGVVFSILLYGELLTIRLVVGFVLIFIALLVSEGIFSWKRKAAS